MKPDDCPILTKVKCFSSGKNCSNHLGRITTFLISPFSSVNFSTACGDRIFFQELMIQVLVSWVVKQAVGQGSNSLYVLECAQDLMPDQSHRESPECQMRNCYAQRRQLVHLCVKSESLVAQINIFELPCHM